MLRIRPALTLTVIAGHLLLSLVPVRAQEQPHARLTLVEQSPFTSPRSKLRVSVEVENRGTEPLASLGMTLSVYYPARSRTEYRRALTGETELAPVLVTPFPVTGTLAVGERRRFTIARPLPELTARAENALYPLKVQLESEGVAVGALRSALVFIHEKPSVPLGVSVTFVLDEGVVMRPGGVFEDDRLAGAVEPGGRVEAVVSALERSPVSATVAISPLLVDQLDRMSRGYRVATSAGEADRPADGGEALAAARMLERLRALTATPSIELAALPLASPSLPSLIAAGLRRDLESQLVRGRDLVAGLLGVAPVEGIMRPPAAELSPAALRALAQRGIHTVIADDGTFPPPSGAPLTPPGTALLTFNDNRTMTAVTPDPELAALLRQDIGDAVLQSQWLLGDLAAIYFEQPSVPRGISLILGPEESPPDPTLVSQIVARLRRVSAGVSPRAGWLEPVKVSRLMQIPPQAGLEHRELHRTPVRRPSTAFLFRLRAARATIEQLESVTEQQAPLVEQLKNLLLTSEARPLLARERAAIGYLEAVQARVRLEFAKVQAPTGSITLTSRRGVIPITVGSTAEYPMRVRVRLVSPRLDFPDGNSETIVLDRAQQALTFPVLAQTTGRFPVRIVVETPSGRAITQSRMVVRSTVYNQRALLVVIAATLFLVWPWLRRVARRTTS